MMIRMFSGLRAVFLMVFVFRLVVSSSGQLQMNYYANSCPRAENLVQDYVCKHVPRSPNLAAAILRVYFHDCFVRVCIMDMFSNKLSLTWLTRQRNVVTSDSLEKCPPLLTRYFLCQGCDGSVLINLTANNQAERDSIPNQTARGFEFIDRVKSILEAECPGIVSCADVLALVSRDSIVVTVLKSPKARPAEALNNIPAPSSNLTTLQRAFANKGLDLKDLVVLSGAHTIGVSHCLSFSNRQLHGERGPGPGDGPKVLKRRGIHQSDSALTNSTSAKAYVTQLLKGSQENFYTEFALAMEKLGRIDAKTGSAGVIRKHCALAN
ncbi:hypothetical protein MLD38_015778 [Melastoma candidum]|uniref:Uncharacterized protein n=1 Tax=Melastoma candidum TaxID=119954 RepID=A0ACB9RIG1_9MYRT|nr:hypothetical protein MLD38_015778 [Melastoma candidum]